MGKGLLYTLLYSVVLVTLFVTFLILIKNLNPPQRKDPDETKKEDDYADEEDFPSDIKLEFGLVKVTDKELDKNFYETYKHEFKSKNYIKDNENITIVVPPVWPSETETNNGENNINSKSQRSIKENYKKNALRKNDFSNRLFIKLKGKDEPRIEIKIVSNNNLLTPSDRSSKKEIDNSPVVEGNVKIENGKIIIFNIGNKFIKTLSEIVDFDHIHNITDNKRGMISENVKNTESVTENYIFNLYDKED